MLKGLLKESKNNYGLDELSPRPNQLEHTAASPALFTQG